MIAYGSAVELFQNYAEFSTAPDRLEPLLPRGAR